VIKGTDKGERFELALRRGFKGGDPDDPVELHELEGLLREVWHKSRRGVTGCSAAISCLGKQLSPRAEMCGAASAIRKQAMIASRDWTTGERPQTPQTWRRLRFQPQCIDTGVAGMETI
jgi:hypothetical protein